MFKLRLGRPEKDPPMFCLAWAGPGPLGVPLVLVPFEEVRPPRPPRRAAAGALSLAVKGRRPEGETGAPAAPPKPAKGSDQAGTRPKWR